MIIDMSDSQHLVVQVNPTQSGHRRVIIDKLENDIRICDDQHVVKLVYGRVRHHQYLEDILVDDICVWGLHAPLKREG